MSAVSDAPLRTVMCVAIADRRDDHDLSWQRVGATPSRRYLFVPQGSRRILGDRGRGARSVMTEDGTTLRLTPRGGPARANSTRPVRSAAGNEHVLATVVVKWLFGEATVERLQLQAGDFEEPEPLVLRRPPQRARRAVVEDHVDPVVTD